MKKWKTEVKGKYGESNVIYIGVIKENNITNRTVSYDLTIYIQYGNVEPSLWEGNENEWSWTLRGAKSIFTRRIIKPESKPKWEEIS